MFDNHHSAGEYPMGTQHVTDGAMIGKIGQVRAAGQRRWDSDRAMAKLLLAVADAADAAHAVQVDAQAAVDSDGDDPSTYDELAGVTGELMRWTPVFAAAMELAHTGHVSPVPYCPRCLSVPRHPVPVLHDAATPPCDHPWHSHQN